MNKVTFAGIPIHLLEHSTDIVHYQENSKIKVPHSLVLVSFHQKVVKFILHYVTTSIHTRTELQPWVRDPSGQGHVPVDCTDIQDPLLCCMSAELCCNSNTPLIGRPMHKVTVGILILNPSLSPFCSAKALLFNIIDHLLDRASHAGFYQHQSAAVGSDHHSVTLCNTDRSLSRTSS